MTSFHPIRRRMRRPLALLAGLLLTLAAAAVLAPAGQGQEIGPASDSQGRPAYVPGEVLVAYKAGLGPTALGGGSRALVTEAAPFGGGTTGDAPGAERVRLAEGVPVADAVRALRGDPAVAYAEPNYLNYLLVEPDDQFWDYMWAMKNTGQNLSQFGATYPHNDGDAENDGKDVDAALAWNSATGSGVMIGIIDTGIDSAHPDLSPNLWDGVGGTNCPSGSGPTNGGCDFADNDSDPSPAPEVCDGFHGTHVAGTAAAAATFPRVAGAATGVPGMAPSATLMALKVFPDNCQGASDADIIAAINYAAANGVDVVNMSLGREGSRSQAVADAIRNAVNSGVLIVAAAGNGGSDGVGDDLDDLPNWPANFDGDSDATVSAGTLTVMASDQADVRATFSNYSVTHVSIAAPGVNILSAYPNYNGGQADYAWSAGTSMSAPLVAGIAALVKGANPGFTPAQVKARINATGEPVLELAGCNATTMRVNAYRALTNTTSTPYPQISLCVDSTSGPLPPLQVGSDSDTPCLITWATEGWLPREALQPLRQARGWLWHQGEWGRALVRGYYRVSAWLLGGREAPRSAAQTGAATLLRSERAAPRAGSADGMPALGMS